MLKPLLLATLGLSVLLTPPALAATSASRDHVTVRVTTPQETVGPSGDVEIAVHYRIDPHWHIYWKNPGDSGAAPKFNIEGGTLQSIAWPYPVRLPVSEAYPHPVTYGRKPAAALGLEPKAAETRARRSPNSPKSLYSPRCSSLTRAYTRASVGDSGSDAPESLVSLSATWRAKNSDQPRSSNLKVMRSPLTARAGAAEKRLGIGCDVLNEKRS